MWLTVSMAPRQKINASTYRRAETALYRLTVGALIGFGLASFAASLGHAYMNATLMSTAVRVAAVALIFAGGCFMAALYCNAMSFRIHTVATVPVPLTGRRTAALLQQRRTRATR
jgi:hypothetical protein